MTTITMTTIAAVVVLAIIAIYTDIRWGKIFNVLTVPFALLGLVLNTVGGGWEGFALSIEGIGLGFAIWLVSSFLGRILGGGDIKLLMAFGALQGPGFLLWALAYGALIGGVMAIAVALRRRTMLKTFKSLGTSLYLRAAAAVPMEIEDGAGEVRLPYAIALGAGAFVALALQIPW
ncbi:MAG: prepilin peptidase [Armatimonadetes bacterium]|nr:prepilin peptidase [Armatimonadota bacterium]